jgi:tetratricopeptide (TPR) repeat protein
MKKTFLGAMLLAFVTTSMTAAPAADDVMVEIGSLQQKWAVANYQVAEKDKEAAFEALVAEAEALTQANPQRAEPKVWEAIIRAGLAGAMGGVSSMFNAMPQMEKGRDLLLEAEKINAGVLNGSVYTTLGSFYYMVPGGFIGFGDTDKALGYLKKGLEIAPDDMDANYFMGDYWLEEKKYTQAKPYFEKVLALPDVASRPIYSKGRKAEATAQLAEVNKKTE